MKRFLKGLGIVLLVLAVVLAAACLGNLHLARTLYYNVLPKKVKLDTSEYTAGKSWEHVQYSDVSETDYMHIYVPDSDEPMPLLVLIHGGGFVTNDLESRQAQFMYRYFRNHGYACATVNYRLAAEAAFPAAVEDVKCAIRYLRANAKTYGYDPERFAVWGESAGGYLAAMAAVTTDDEFNSLPYIGEEESSEKVSASVKVLMNFYGAVELGGMEEEFEQMGIPSLIRTLSAGWVNVHLKGTGYGSVEEFWLRKNFREMTAEERHQSEPFWYMEKNLNRDTDLHTLIWYGGADITVPCTSGEHMAYLMKGLTGSDKVWYEKFPTYLHAADSYYSEENLGRIRDWLDEVFYQ